MGKYRVFSKSVRFTIRSRKRFIVFMLIFAIISTFVALFVDSIDTLQTDDFLEQKGLVLNQLTTHSVTYTQSEALLAAIEDEAGAIETHVSYYYASLDPTLNIFSIDIDNPWMNGDINPSYLKEGRFPRANDEILIPAESLQYTNSTGDLKYSSDIIVGQTLKFSDGSLTRVMKVVGTIEVVGLDMDIIDVSNSLWLFADISLFENMLEFYGMDMADAYTYAMSFTVPGVILMPSTYEAIDNLNNDIKAIRGPGTEAEYGEWRFQATALPEDEAKQDAERLMLSLVVAIVGGMILAVLLSYLISRFRRREIAVLKALGYSNASVRLSLMGEIATTAFTGFVIGLTAAQISLLDYEEFNTTNLIRWISILVSFVVNVLITLPGMVVVSRRILKVSPAEAFRDK
ncbi:MAG: ABC transporter permease [Candidatus Heimdallarchaeota archaeon]|nr:ABC transporter permease [Candidatus Heimdallarchaeota archaeon]